MIEESLRKCGDVELRMCRLLRFLSPLLAGDTQESYHLSFLVVVTSTTLGSPRTLLASFRRRRRFPFFIPTPSILPRLNLDGQRRTRLLGHSVPRSFLSLPCIISLFSQTRSERHQLDALTLIYPIRPPPSPSFLRLTATPHADPFFSSFRFSISISFVSCIW